VSAIKDGEREIRYGKADLTSLDQQIAYHERQCALATGQTPARTRYAKSMRFRCY
jgi:hypothetical protein